MQTMTLKLIVLYFFQKTYSFNFNFNSVISTPLRTYTQVAQPKTTIDIIPGMQDAFSVNDNVKKTNKNEKIQNLPHLAEWMSIPSTNANSRSSGLTQKYHDLLAHKYHKDTDHKKGEYHKNSLASSKEHYAKVQELEGNTKVSVHHHDFEKMEDLRLTKRAKKVFNELVEENKILHQQLSRLQTHCFV